MEEAKSLSKQLSEWWDKKPRPLKKWYGPNPTPENITEYEANMKAWNREYRRLSKAYKAQVELDNAEYWKQKQQSEV